MQENIEYISVLSTGTGEKGDGIIKPRGGQTSLTAGEKHLLVNRLQFRNNLPGREFVYSFVRCHKDVLASRICQIIKRARAAISPEVINAYFDELEEKERTGVPPSNIINYDETGNGVILPPYAVYRAQHLYQCWTQGGPTDARYNQIKSGRFDCYCFEDWLQTIAIPYLKRLEGKRLLIGDHLSSHLSVFIFLPSNSTHLTQPLDVAFFQPTKMKRKEITLEWKKRACFKKCGIAPLSQNKVLQMLQSITNTYLDKSSNDHEETANAINASLLELLKALRQDEDPQKKTKRNALQKTNKSLRWQKYNHLTHLSSGDYAVVKAHVSPALAFHSDAAPYSPRFTLINYRDLNVKSHPNHSTHLSKSAQNENTLVSIACRASDFFGVYITVCHVKSKDCTVYPARMDVPASGDCNIHWLGEAMHLNAMSTTNHS
ncbi:hypothetical protein PR048_033388 [Dryococelus australis]|uniref:DDE-1 domain-containing protein n=1 Tax=Dryococelus australis TaxID=614101 RepID=A0ABQ9G063_9NEOP|nr:hypothetical protein PR048_033388 [Dryococelus australis]